MILTIIESPYAGDVERNLKYVRACMKHSLSFSEAPFPSHALYTQEGVLDDTIPEERKLGMEAGFAWGKWAQRVAIYLDLGWSRGMREGLERAENRGCEVRTRTLGAPWSDLAPSDAELQLREVARRNAVPVGIDRYNDQRITPSVDPLSVKRSK